jgi:putative RNA 2'-phosphotransferase
MEPSLVRISKFISLVLRHDPAKIGLALDENGWADVNELLRKAGKAGVSIDRSMLEQVVAQNEKKRFVFSADGQRIRASQGHSISVDLALEPISPPNVLYHGTATRFQASILEKGLVPGQRNHVHLSADTKTAIMVGKRHGQPIVFTVKAREMEQAGFSFYLSENKVWLTAAVPPEYLAFLNE